MAEVDTLPAGPAFPRPTSLFHPERHTAALLDSSSYSPFPTIGGSRRDPFGLDAYLLHPEDQLWSYLAPSPIAPLDVGPSASSAAGAGAADKGSKSRAVLSKRPSIMALRKPSPLSQAPVSATQSQTTLAPPQVTPATGLSRRRSKSFDSSSSRSTATLVSPEAPAGKDKAAGGTVGRKGLRGFWGRRKSISSMSSVSVSPGSSSLSSATTTPVGSDVDVSVIPKSRSSLNLTSESESAGSTSGSSDGPHTPRDSPMLAPVDAMPVKAAALLIVPRAEDGPKKKGFRSLFTRRGSSVALAAAAVASEPAEVSASSSALQPARTVANATEPVSRVTPTEEQRATAFVGDQVRRSTYRKLGQLRRPSPHPLATHLRRQYSHLPQEVISSLEAGQAVHPRSVNYHAPLSGLAPAQGGLWTTLAVKIILEKLDAGHALSGLMTKRVPPVTVPSSSTERRARSMADFVSRLPFEERHYVHYPGAWSPVSMARPGFGVWDLDFSAYILGLADVGRDEYAGAGAGASHAPWPVMPRPSFGAVEDALQPDVYTEQGSAMGAQAELGTQMRDLEVYASETTTTVDSPVELDKAATPTASPSSSLVPLDSPDEKSSGSEGEGESGSGSGSSDEGKMLLVTPPVEAVGPTIPEIKIDFEDALDGSSFRKRPALGVAGGARLSRGYWSGARGDESDESDADADEEDDRMALAQIKAQAVAVKKASMPAMAHKARADPHERGHARQKSLPFATPLPPLSTSNGKGGMTPSTSFATLASGNATASGQKRSSTYDDVRLAEQQRQHQLQQRAMDEVARARERRHALSTGEVDKRAEAELRREAEAKRRLVAFDALPHSAPGSSSSRRQSGLSPSASSSALSLRPQSTGGSGHVAAGKRVSMLNVSQTDERRRTMSGPALATATAAGTSRGHAKLGETKRYHSFYEVQADVSAVASAKPQPSRGGSYPSPRVQSSGRSQSMMMMSPGAGAGTNIAAALAHPGARGSMLMHPTPPPPSGMMYGVAGMYYQPQTPHQHQAYPYASPVQGYAGLPMSASMGGLAYHAHAHAQAQAQAQVYGVAGSGAAMQYRQSGVGAGAGAGARGSSGDRRAGRRVA